MSINKLAEITGTTTERLERLIATGEAPAATPTVARAAAFAKYAMAADAVDAALFDLEVITAAL